MDQALSASSGTMTSSALILAGQGETRHHTLPTESFGVSRQTADLFADAGYLVVIPDFFRGTWRSPTAPDVADWAKEQTLWSKLKLDLEKIVLPFAKSKGVSGGK